LNKKNSRWFYQDTAFQLQRNSWRQKLWRTIKNAD